MTKQEEKFARFLIKNSTHYLHKYDDYHIQSMDTESMNNAIIIRTVHDTHYRENVEINFFDVCVNLFQEIENLKLENIQNFGRLG